MPPPAFQYLYGSGEGAAISVQAYQALTRYVLGGAAESRVLVADATLDAPRWEACEAKPKAVVLDADETALLNLGVEEWEARAPGPFDEKRWERWEKTGDQAVTAVPGAVDAFAALRQAGVAIIFNTNRSAVTAEGTERALAAAGLGSFKHGETLFLKGDVDGKSGKDGRRAEIAKRFCVVALVGDQLGDFSDRFAIASVAARRAAVTSGPIAKLWGQGWFVLPNPVYGSALKGGFDDVFPADKSWIDPVEEK